jgi:hypothetical protein
MNTKKLTAYALTLCMVLMLTPAFTLTASAATYTWNDSWGENAPWTANNTDGFHVQDGDTIIISGNASNSLFNSLTIPAGATVTVTGAAAPEFSDSAIRFNIETGATVIWNASYTRHYSGSPFRSAVSVSGNNSSRDDGTFIMAGGKITEISTSGDPSYALYVGDVRAVIRGGEISANGVGGAIALYQAGGTVAISTAASINGDNDFLFNTHNPLVTYTPGTYAAGSNNGITLIAPVVSISLAQWSQNTNEGNGIQIKLYGSIDDKERDEYYAEYFIPIPGVTVNIPGNGGDNGGDPGNGGDNPDPGDDDSDEEYLSLDIHTPDTHFERVLRIDPMDTLLANAAVIAFGEVMLTPNNVFNHWLVHDVMHLKSFAKKLGVFGAIYAAVDPNKVVIYNDTAIPSHARLTLTIKNNSDAPYDLSKAGLSVDASPNFVFPPWDELIADGFNGQLTTGIYQPITYTLYLQVGAIKRFLK